MTNETPQDYGVFTFDGVEHKILKDPNKIIRSGAVVNLLTDPRTKWNDEQKNFATFWAIAERLFSEEDYALLLEHDAEELFTELSAQVYGVDQGN